MERQEQNYIFYPIVVDADSYELVTKENMVYYDLNSDWVKDFKKEMQSLYY